MHEAKHCITILDGIDYHAHGKKVIYLIDRLILFLHFPVDTVEMLGPAFDLRFYAEFRSFSLYFVNDGIYVFNALAALFCDFFNQIIVFPGMQISETAVLQLPFDPRDTKPVCQRSIYLQGFSGLLLLLVLRHIFQCMDIVFAICKLYQYDADILGHGQEHLPEVFRLLFLFGGIRYLVKLGHAIYEHGNRITKLLPDLVKGTVGILHRIMQKTGNNRGTVHLQISKYMRDLNRMYDIRLAGFPQLAFMRFFGHGISLVEQFEITAGIIFLYFLF